MGSSRSLIGFCFKMKIGEERRQGEERKEREEKRRVRVLQVRGKNRREREEEG